MGSISQAKKISLKTGESDREDRGDTHVFSLESGFSDHLPRLRLPSKGIDELSTRVNLKAITKELLQPEPNIKESWVVQESWAIDDALTWILPIVPADHITIVGRNSQQAVVASEENQVPVLLKLIKSSGIYGLSSMASPLISLVLAPFLTHNLSPSDYGILTILNAVISLVAGITQLGLTTAFFRAYNFDYTSSRDKRDVIATTTTLLFVVSMVTALGVAISSPFIAELLLSRSSFAGLITIAAGILLVQNLTVPGFAWLRAENRAFFYSLLSISNLLISLLANIVLVGMLHLGVAGSLLAVGGGYASVVICTIPIIVFHVGIKIRIAIARNLLGFGLPLILNLISYWALQVSDRYLLSRFSSFTETAKYTVVYTLGSAIAVVVISPFTLAWPTTMFAIAKRKNAAQVFKNIFRWFSLFLLFAAFGLSFIGTLFLNWLFPVAYHSAVFIIPIVATSIAFYGVYFIFMIGANILRKTWMAGVFTTVAASANFILNLILIPRFGAMGAAISTLIAYILLAIIAYIANRKIYPISYQIGRFIVALLLGAALYAGSSFFAGTQAVYAMCGIYISALVLYAGCLAILAKLPAWKHKFGYDNYNVPRNLIGTQFR